jgi:isopentenyldiphosphate isomerase/intracellular septation protein A
MNLSRLLKSLLPSFIPLIVYVLADAVFGEKVGLVVGVGVGVIEFIVVLVRDRKPDPFVAADTALLALAGAVSFLSGNDLYFKLKPAVLELVFGASFALLLVLPPRYLKTYMERQVRGIEFPEESLPLMRKNLGTLLAVLGLHAGLTVWAAVALSTRVWGFISGVLLYILFGCVLLTELVLARLARGKLRAAAGAGRGEAMLPLVDAEGKVTGQAPERLCHAGAPGSNAAEDGGRLLHPALRVFVVDGKGRLFLRRTAARAGEGPGPWDAPVTRHIHTGESLDDAVARGVRECLGLSAVALAAAKAAPGLALRYKRDDDRESELVFLFFLPSEGPFALDAAGGEEGSFFDPDRLGAAARAGELSPRFLHEYGLLAAAVRGGDGTAAD